MQANRWVRRVRATWSAVVVCGVSLVYGALAPEPATAADDLVVAKDGSGDFTTVKEGLAAAKRLGAARDGGPVRVFIKAGVYKEKLVVRASNLTLVGEDARRTVLTYDDYVGKPDGSADGKSGIEMPSTIVRGDDFTARNLTFANTAGAVSQASALWVDGDRERFFDCRIVGYQDTLYTSPTRQFYKRCYIEGAVDFIYGSATAVFDRCTLFCTGQESGCITAASTPRKKRGFLFRKCVVAGTAPAGSVFLGRPWRPHAEVAFVKCNLGNQVPAVGWDNWGDARNEASVRYREYRNTGEGADTGGRVGWARRLTAGEAGEYTLKRMFGGGTSGGAMDLTMEDLWYRDDGG